jgi:hypothetical protein
MLMLWRKLERNVSMSSHPANGRDPETLLHASSYTEEELSRLVGVGVYEIRRAAREGRLRARIVDEQVISISRDDALEWLNSLEEGDNREA